jgi:hypothetical protein
MKRADYRQRSAKPKPRRKASGGKTKSCKSAHYWSARVTKESDALDLENGVFTWNDPKRIAASLKRLAEASRRRKADPFRSGVVDARFLHQSRR